MRFAHHIALPLALLIAPVYLNLARAQSTTGTISGNITDSSGAPVAGAKVAVDNSATIARVTAAAMRQVQFGLRLRF